MDGRFDGQNAVQGLRNIQRALQVLDGPDRFDPSADEIAESFGYVWAAMHFADLWPSALRVHAAGLIVSMRRYGSFYETAQRFSHGEVRELIDLLRHFLSDADRFEDSELAGPPPHRPPGLSSWGEA